MAPLPLTRGPATGSRAALNTFEPSRVVTAHKAVRRGCDWNEVVLRDGEAFNAAARSTNQPNLIRQGIHEPKASRPDSEVICTARLVTPPLECPTRTGHILDVLW